MYYNDYELIYLLTWHSEEALHILLKKYDALIMTRLEKLNILKYHYTDYIQELRMEVLAGIKKYSEHYGKSLCKYLELIIDRRIIRLLNYDTRGVRTVQLNDEMYSSGTNTVLDKMIYENLLQEIASVELDELKKDILNKVLLEGMSIKDYALINKLSTKDIYNHIYLLRLKLKGKLNL